MTNREVLTLSNSVAGYGIHWPLIDEDLAIDPLIQQAEQLELRLPASRELQKGIARMLADNSLHFRMYVLMTGIEDGLNFEVEREDGNRIQNVLMGAGDDGNRQFVCFTSTDGRWIALNVDCIDMINFLWEVGAYLPEAEEHGMDVEIHFQGRTEPFSSVPATEDEMDSLVDELADMPRGGRAFFSFRDVDDEVVTWRADHAKMIIARTEWNFTEDEMEI